MAYFKVLRLRVERLYLKTCILFQTIFKQNIFLKKKLKLIGLFVILFFSFFSYFNLINAQEDANPTLPYDSAQRSYSKYSIPNIEGSITTQILGVDATIDPNSGAVSMETYPGGGAMGTIARATGIMYQEGPVSTEQYFAYLVEKADLGPASTYAQDGPIQGFDILRPIINLWSWARNIVYIFYVVIFLIIGVMIILRQRIGGQIPITIINSIPNVILSLLLVTFSYAISGLIIDLMHLITGIIYAGLFGAGGPGSGIEGNFTFQDSEMSVLQIFGTAQVTDFSFAFNLEDIKGLEGAWIINTVIEVIGEIGKWNTLVSVVLSIAAVAAMFKIFFSLLSFYLTLMLYPVVAPFLFLLGSFPGNFNTIVDWFRRMFSSAGAFVGVYAAFCIMIIITQGSEIGDWQWFPPLTGFSATTDTIRHLLSYALFITTPAIPAAVQQMFQGKPGAPGMGLVGVETQKAISKIPIIGGLFG